MEKKKSKSYKNLALVFILIDLFLILFLVSNTNIETSKYENISNLNENKNNTKMNQTKKMDGNIALFETSEGNFKIELFLEKAPITAGNFKSLIEKGFYDETKFHRVIQNFMIQGGDPLSKNDSLKNRWGTGGAETIEDEFIKGLSNTRGTLSMANSGPQSGSSQFFINVIDNLNLDWDKGDSRSKHPVFAKVIEGMDIVDKISKVSTEKPYDRPSKNIIIISAKIIN